MYFQIEIRRDYRNRPAVDGDEGRAKHFVTPNDLVNTLLQGIKIDRPEEFHRDGNIEYRRAGHQLIEKPKPLLGE